MPPEYVQNEDDDDQHSLAEPLDLAAASPFTHRNDAVSFGVMPLLQPVSQSLTVPTIDDSGLRSSNDNTSQRMPPPMPSTTLFSNSEPSEDPMVVEEPPLQLTQGTSTVDSSAATSPANVQAPLLPSLPSPPQLPFNPERFGRNLLLDALMSGLVGPSARQVHLTPESNNNSPGGVTTVPLPADGTPYQPPEGVMFPGMLQALTQLQQNQNEPTTGQPEAQGSGAASSSGGGGRQVPVVIFGVRTGPPQRNSAGPNASSPTSVSTHAYASSATGAESASQPGPNVSSPPAGQSEPAPTPRNNTHHGILNSITEMFSGLGRQRANRASLRNPASTNESPENARDPEQWRLFVVALTDQPTVVGSASAGPTDAAGANTNPQLPNLASIFAPRPPPAGEAAPEGAEAPTTGSEERNEPGTEQAGPDGADPILAMLLQVILGIIVSGGAPGGEGTTGNGYEDLLRLAELLGPGRARNASSADVEREIPTVIYCRAEVSGDAQQMRGKKRRRRTEGGGGEGKRSRVEGKGKGKEDAGTEEMEVDGGEEEAYSDEEMVDVSNDATSGGSLRVADLLGGTHERCTVCLMEYEDGDELRILRCAHGFHKACLDQWVTSYVNSCPICRKPCVEVTNNNSNAENVEAGGHAQDRPILPPWLNAGNGVGAIPISFTHESPEMPAWLNAIPRPPTPPLGFLRSRRQRRTMPTGQSPNEWNIEVHINIESENPADGQNGGEDAVGNEATAGDTTGSGATDGGGGGRRRSSRGSVRFGPQNGGGILPDFMSSVRDLFRRFSGGRDGRR
ncbi:hypothetical protein BJ742DRAFT_50637 [Cladochytrium replicatum]|nr:hypothetical protein BJ742DRAFT_50637 [Cladochytrium replicatum]